MRAMCKFLVLAALSTAPSVVAAQSQAQLARAEKLALGLLGPDAMLRKTHDDKRGTFWRFYVVGVVEYQVVANDSSIVMSQTPGHRPRRVAAGPKPYLDRGVLLNLVEQRIGELMKPYEFGKPVFTSGEWKDPRVKNRNTFVQVVFPLAAKGYTFLNGIGGVTVCVNAQSGELYGYNERLVGWPTETPEIKVSQEQARKKVAALRKVDVRAVKLRSTGWWIGGIKRAKLAYSFAYPVRNPTGERSNATIEIDARTGEELRSDIAFWPFSQIKESEFRPQKP